jgi:type I restriction enzyme, S subunit
MNVPMPQKNTIWERVARAADKCLRLACEKAFPVVTLGEVSQVLSGGTPSTERADFWDGEIVWITPKDLGKPRAVEVDQAERTITRLGSESSSARVLPKGTVLLSSRAPIGHVGIAGRPLATNQGFKNIVCGKSLNNRYLFHILRGSIDELAAQGRGNTFMEIPGKVVKDFRVPLPPLPVQEAIAIFLDTLYIKLSGTHVRLPELPPPLTDQRKLIVTLDAIAPRVQEMRQLRDDAIAEREALLPSEIKTIFESGKRSGWKKSRLGDYVVDDCYGTSQKVNDDPAGIPVLRMGNIQNGRLDLRRLKYLHLDENDRRKLLLRQGDLLVNRTNSAELVGKSAVFNCDGDYAFASYLIRLRLDLDKADPYLVAYFINSPVGRAYMFSERRQMTGQANVNATKLKALPIALPPLVEQRRITSHLDALAHQVDMLRRLQFESAVELDALLPSILSKAFNGEL